MKMKKVGRLLSLVVAGAMALSMIPAAFAADDDTAHVEPTSSCFHDHMTYVSNGDGSTHKEICNDCHVTLDDQASCMFMDGKCTKCDAPDPTCEHVNQSPVDNGDGTCSYVCDTCHKVISTQDHVYYDGETACALCGAPKPACQHINQRGVDNGDGTCSYVCKDCNTVISTQAHVYYDGETACALCGAPCRHNAGEEYESTGHGTHKVLCKDCKKVMDELGCTYVNGECQKCHDADPTEKPCDHVNQIPVNNGDGTCSYVCKDCNTVIDTQAHVYYNGETACARCGAVCEHVNQSAKDNGDGTCSYVCDNCHTVIDTQPHIYYDGETACARCGAVCEHVNQTAKDNGDGTCSYVCDTCHTVIDTMAHVYYEGETACARCGFVCDHMGQKFEFSANNDDTHNVLCADCKTVVSENVPCTYIDGKCQQCGAVCQHVKQHAVDNEDGTCSYVCDKCNTVIDTVAHIYYEGEDACARCGAPKAACKHLNENYEYVDNGNGTHNVVCADCGAVAQENVACDYILDECVHCGGLYAGGNVPFFVSTGKGLLRSLRSFFMSLFIR